MGGIIKMNDMLLLMKHIVIVKPFIITHRADEQTDIRTDRQAGRRTDHGISLSIYHISIYACRKFSCGKFNFYYAYVMQSGEKKYVNFICK